MICPRCHGSGRQVIVWRWGYRSFGRCTLCCGLGTAETGGAG